MLVWAVNSTATLEAVPVLDHITFRKRGEHFAAYMGGFQNGTGAFWLAFWLVIPVLFIKALRERELVHRYLW